jgi:hypothetical protein
MKKSNKGKKTHNSLSPKNGTSNKYIETHATKSKTTFLAFARKHKE